VKPLARRTTEFPKQQATQTSSNKQLKLQATSNSTNFKQRTQQNFKQRTQQATIKNESLLNVSKF
jgi:hypothetical protein